MNALLSEIFSSAFDWTSSALEALVTDSQLFEAVIVMELCYTVGLIAYWISFTKMSGPLVY